MKKPSSLHAILAVAGLGVLTAYILACVGGPSFSPDDTKLAFPAMDPVTADMGISIYDRKSRSVRQIFVPTEFEKLDGSKEKKPTMMRPEWTPDGQNIVVLWRREDNEVLGVAVVPARGEGTTRLFALPDMKMKGEKVDPNIYMPLILVRNRLFLLASKDEKTNQVVCLDLTTGTLRTHSLEADVLYAGPHGDTIYYQREGDNSPDQQTDVGRLDPDTFAQTSLWKLKDADIPGKGASLVIAPDGKRLAVVTTDEDKVIVKFLHGQIVTKRLPPDVDSQKCAMGFASFALKKEIIYAPFTIEGATNCALGLLEVPLNEEPIRFTPLAHLKKLPEGGMMHFPMGLSHDGRTAALSATSLWQESQDKGGIRPEDCTLFLVDLMKENRPVTRVSLPTPKITPSGP